MPDKGLSVGGSTPGDRSVEPELDHVVGNPARNRSVPTIAVIMACHNRRQVTARSLQALKNQSSPELHLCLFITDDGSTDGTSEAIRQIWPQAKVILGSGHLFWAAGMALAERSALTSDPDYLLWLNDDTVLEPGALKTLLDVSHTWPASIVVGATHDPDTGEPTYGGRVRVDYHPQRFHRLPISAEPQQADTFNGNVVLVPVRVSRRVGPIDEAFPHAYADDDYGLRATALGIPIIQASGTVASCPANTSVQVKPATLLGRWQQLQSPKGLPWKAQVRYLRRHGDWRWPAILISQTVLRLLVPGRGTPTDPGDRQAPGRLGRAGRAWHVFR